MSDTAPKKIGRPLAVIDEKQVVRLARINCTVAEIAAVCGVSRDTITNRFYAALEKGRECGKSSLKRKMWKIAMDGNVAMCIWLSKQMLGYTDKQEVVLTDEEKIILERYRQLKKQADEKIFADDKPGSNIDPNLSRTETPEIPAQ